ncbi:armadillo repeat protein [Grosmannia clavigera kw1407]|uniref:Armadillo repeat protein n=1 Tax=Grosmannia clavigera (strain kw1407 / UAMH 11150) TaxID=655863 RepID=F0XA99_GROCL|nr:armadillo repeat protein [Grosmannia clavigera kw1407]EFX05894.1 armadillo repeat protein [Grosmannia clavigera kw1407]
MGKSRRNRAGASNRSDPVGGRPRTVKEPSDPQLAALRNDKILPVVKDLRSADPKTRTTAAGAIANIVEDSKCRKLLLREQIVHIVLTETLADSSIESRAAGWEILNVLAQNEESDFCVHLFRCDVLTPAEHALSQVLETLQSTETPFSKLTKAQQEFVWRITLSIIDLVGQLAEARSEILEAVTGNAAITRAFFALVCTSAAPFEIHWAAVTCLARLCDDQRALSQAVVDDQVSGCYQSLLKLTEAGGPMAVAACSVLHSVFATLEWFDHSPGRDGASDAILVPVLTKALEQQQQEPKDKAEDHSTEVLGQALQVLAMMGTTLDTSLEKGNRDEVALLGGARKGALLDEGEELAGGDDDSEAGEGSDAEMMEDEEEGVLTINGKKRGKEPKTDGSDAGGESDEEMDDADLDADMENVTGADEKDAEVSELGDLPTLRELIGTAVPQIMRVVKARPQDVDEAALAIRLDALSALNNIAWTVSCIDLADEGNAGIRQAWGRAARQIWLEVVRPLVTGAITVDLQVAAKVTGLAWALARVLGGETPADAGEQERFMAMRDSLSGSSGESGESVDGSDPFQSPSVMCIGVLGQMARDPAPVATNRKIGEYFLGVVEALPATPIADAVEALNQLFDIYGDEKAECDKAVFWPGKFLARLEADVAKIKAAAKTIDKRTASELRTRTDEAVLNLGRFVQYKKKHAS